jgi:hypothetical protein
MTSPSQTSSRGEPLVKRDRRHVPNLSTVDLIGGTSGRRASTLGRTGSFWFDDKTGC